jgi:hypothetical protein
MPTTAAEIVVVPMGDSVMLGPAGAGLRELDFD